jgi:hypothetical protein
MKILEPDNTLIFSNFDTSYILKYDSDDDIYKLDGKINLTVDIDNIINEKIENIVIFNSYIEEHTNNKITFPYHIKNIFIVERNNYYLTDINKLKIPFGCEIVKKNDWKLNRIDDYYMFGCVGKIPTINSDEIIKFKNFSNHL